MRHRYQRHEKLGISENGRRCISALLVPVMKPGHKNSVPIKTASTKSAMPKRFQARNVLPSGNRRPPLRAQPPTAP